MDGLTVRLPTRIDGRRHFHAEWMAWTGLGTLAGIVSAIDGAGMGSVLVGLCSGGLYGLMMATAAEPVLGWLGVRTFNGHTSRKHTSGYLSIVLFAGMMTAVLIAQLLNHILSGAVLIAAIPISAVLLVLLSLSIGLPASLRRGTLRLDPAGFTLGRRRWLFEDIRHIAPHGSQIRINGRSVPGLQGLSQPEQAWLYGTLQHHLTLRRGTLQAAGHDLSRPAAVPEQLTALRDVD